jgi:hypothetical protein
MSQKDKKGNEIMAGDYVYFSHLQSSLADTRSATQKVLRVSYTDFSRFVVEYKYGWPPMEYEEHDLAEQFLNKGDRNCWYVTTVVDGAETKIPPNLIATGDKRLIQAFIRLEGFDIKLEDIDL